MERSWVDVYLHFVWGTKNRLPLITQERERMLYRCIEEEARHLGCTVLAIGGTEDHVHLAVQLPSIVSPAKLMQVVKGVSSHFANQCTAFDWQDNYAVFSLSRPDVVRVINYVQHQKQHHADNTVWPQWERTSETITRP